MRVEYKDDTHQKVLRVVEEAYKEGRDVDIIYLNDDEWGEFCGKTDKLWYHCEAEVFYLSTWCASEDRREIVHFKVTKREA
jgi:hypothetical protein